MQGIPPARETDSEDVVWGLQTADALWKRGERIDALVWLRRAAQAAGETNDDDRALELARSAAELAEYLASQPAAETVIPEAGPSITVDFSSRQSIDLEEPPPPSEEKPAPRSNRAPYVPVPPLRPGQRMLRIPPKPDLADEPDEHPHDTATMPKVDLPSDGRVSVSSVLPAEKVHAGMFDPWAEQEPPVPTPPEAPTRPRSLEEEERVISNLRGQQITQPDVVVAPPRPKVPPPLPPKARSMKPPVAPRPLSTVATTRPAPAPPPESEPLEPPPPVANGVESVENVESEKKTPLAPPIRELALDDVDAFADLPDDARAAFARAATLDELAEGEEVGSFALAYVVDGAFDVAATVVDAPAVRLAKGSVLRARGTTDDGVPMRLISAEGRGVLATWSDAAVTDAFRTCPWVEEDLRVAADRVQTLVGITIGPLGERLDASIREQILGRLTMRPLEAKEIIVRAGDPVPGLLLVGVGGLELVDGDGRVIGVIGSGEFLFPTEVLGAGAAPASARAGAGGALVMFGDRKIAQELLVTCPPLLEVFAGM